MICRSVRLGLLNSKVESHCTVMVKSVQHFDLWGGGQIMKGLVHITTHFPLSHTILHSAYPLGYCEALFIACKNTATYYVISETPYFSWCLSWFSSVSQDWGPPPYIHIYIYIHNIYYICIYVFVTGIWVGRATGYGLDDPWIESRWGRDFPPVLMGTWAHPASVGIVTELWAGRSAIESP